MIIYPMRGRDQRAAVWFIMPIVMNDGYHESYCPLSMETMFNLHGDKKVRPLKHPDKVTVPSLYSASYGRI